MIKCIAIDDEPLALELLIDNISKVPFLQLTGSYDNAIDAMKAIELQQPDLVFLDIQMPGLTGLQFIQSLRIKPIFILVTAYEKYALEGYNLDVTDYLVKPVALDRFIKACNKAQELFLLKQQQSAPSATPEYIFVPVEYSLVKINLSDILYVEGLKDYIKIHLSNSSRSIVTRMPMKSMEEQLPAAQFIRIHKSYIASVQHITAIRKTSVFIGDMELPVSDLYRDSIQALTGKA